MSKQLAPPANPLLTETVRGLAGCGRAQLDYLNYLIVQAAVMLLWWPSTELFWRLENPERSDPLLVLLVTVGLTVSYYNLRAGAEELLLPGQHSLREWVRATPVRLSRILSGYFAGQLLQTLHALALSSPLLLMAFYVSGNQWDGLGLSLLTIVFQATCFRLLGATACLAMGHFGMTTFLALRAALLLVYALTGILFPVMNHLVVTSQLLAGNQTMGSSFLLLYGFAIGVLTLSLYWLLARERRFAVVSGRSESLAQVASGDE